MTDAEPPLTCSGLAVMLQAQGYPPTSYGIGRRGKYQDHAFVLDHWVKRWVVYYTERGARSEVRKHVSEVAACRDLLPGCGATRRGDRAPEERMLRW